MVMMTERLLITGATGLLGFALLRQALLDGYHVVFTARSEEKAKTLLSNPAIQELKAGDRLSYVIVVDITATGAFDKALEGGITAIVHIGSPNPKAGNDHYQFIYEPLVKSTRMVLEAAKKASTVKNIVIPTSFYGYMSDETSRTEAITASYRYPISASLPTAFSNGPQAYKLGKRVVLDIIDDWNKNNEASLCVYNVPTGWLFGRDRHWLTAEDMTTQPNFINRLHPAFTGGKSHLPMPPMVTHLEDAVLVILKLALGAAPKNTSHNLGVAINTDWSTTWGIVKEAFPEAAGKGILTEGEIENNQYAVDCSETERVLGIKFKGYDEMVKDVVEQYLELTNKTFLSI